MLSEKRTAGRGFAELVSAKLIIKILVIYN